MPEIEDSVTQSLPSIALDGANIAMHRNSSKKPGDAAGILTAYDYFLSRGHEVKAFIDQWRMYERNKKGLLLNVECLEKIKENGDLVTVPSGSDDDSFFIQYGIETNSVLITNDGLKDHIERLSGDELTKFKDWKMSKICKYAFAGEIFIPDPNFKMCENEKQPSFVKEQPSKVLNNKKESIPEKKKKNTPKYKYYCPICDEKFRRWKHALAHKKETGHGSYICDECSEIFPRVSGKETHTIGTGHTKFSGDFISQNQMSTKNLSKLKTANADHVKAVLEEMVSVGHVKAVLEELMADWVRVSRVSQEINKQFGAPAKSILKEIGGGNGKVIEQLEKLFPNSIEKRGKEQMMDVKLESASLRPTPTFPVQSLFKKLRNFFSRKST